jgi:UDP-N-acetylmuramyl pentapeptide synthase
VGRAAVEEGVPGSCVHSFETSEDAAASIGELIGKGDAVLVKGSRAMRMDVIADRIRGRAEYGGREG